MSCKLFELCTFCNCRNAFQLSETHRLGDSLECLKVELGCVLGAEKIAETSWIRQDCREECHDASNTDHTACLFQVDHSLDNFQIRNSIESLRAWPWSLDYKWINLALKELNCTVWKHYDVSQTSRRSLQIWRQHLQQQVFEAHTENLMWSVAISRLEVLFSPHK